ncbi:hypothetical protein [Mycobacterium sp.]|uniref:hypothetical protein n=1 Tax=Mycobacterium sp. TaxID=1785 RepID=UPI0031CEA5A9
MTVYDAPDYQKVVTTVTATGPVDAPDWERVVVGPGGKPVGGGGSTASVEATQIASRSVSGNVTTQLASLTIPAGKAAILTGGVLVNGVSGFNTHQLYVDSSTSPGGTSVGGYAQQTSPGATFFYLQATNYYPTAAVSRTVTLNYQSAQEATVGGDSNGSGSGPLFSRFVKLAW